VSGLELLAPFPPGWGLVLLVAFARSVEVALGGFALGLAIGIGGALGKLYGGPATRDLLAVYTTVVRAVPELVLVVLLYYAGGDLLNAALAVFGLGPVDVGGLATGVFVIAMVQGAYSTEVVRGAIRAVPAGEVEAARAFGMSGSLLARRILLPAMLPHAIPGLSNLWLIATKDTALLAVVGFAELTLATRQAAGSTKAYFLFYCAAGLLYLALTLGSAALFSAVERRARRGHARPAA
jgi:polar amino acid transport system permease protein